MIEATAKVVYSLCSSTSAKAKWRSILYMLYHLSSSSEAGVSGEVGRVFGYSTQWAQFEDFQHQRDIMRSLPPFLCLFLVWTKGAWALDPILPFMVYLDQSHLVCLKWGFDNMQGNITFKLAVNTTGWVGFGFSPNGDMKGSDIVIGGLGLSGSYFTVCKYHILPTTCVAVCFRFPTYFGSLWIY